MLFSMSTFPTEVLFLGDASGQSETTTIGGCRYERGERYTEVPIEHYAKGGFHVTNDLDGVVVVRRTSPRRGIVLGTAPCMWDDLAAAQALVSWDVIAVNGAGFMYADPIEMWVSIHGDALVEWIEKRRALDYNMHFNAYGNFKPGEDSGSVIEWNKPNGGGSSGLFAVMVALEMGYERLILCGMPLEGQERFDYDGREIITAETAYRFYRSGWKLRAPLLRGHVRSMSGWTRETFGDPTSEWLNS
jgi:hypothetical protein